MDEEQAVSEEILDPNIAFWEGLNSGEDLQRIFSHFNEELETGFDNVGSILAPQDPMHQIQNGSEMAGVGTQDPTAHELAKNFLANQGVAGPDAQGAPDTCLPTVFNVWGPQVIRAEVIEEASFLAPKMMGNAYKEMEEAGSSFIPQLVPSVCSTLQKYQDGGVDITAELVTKEVSKWVYIYMASQNPPCRVAVHPQHIKDLHIGWHLANPGRFYMSKQEVEDMVKETGMTERHVSMLFENERKRKLKEIPEVARELKSHFSLEISTKLKASQTQILPRKRPNKVELEALLKETGLNKRQIADWFNNHRAGRNQRNRRRRR